MKNADRAYSQNGEDILLWKFFEEKSSGFYVDVGAFDGIHLSNSYFFEQRGWGGVCVEAHPYYFKLCRNTRANSITIHAACVATNAHRTVKFFLEDLGLLSGLDQDRFADISKRYRNRGMEFPGFDEVQVPALVLTEILEEHLPNDINVDILSVDVEGSELDVLRGLDLWKFRPRVIICEANTREAKRYLMSYFRDHDYLYAGNLDCNLFFVLNNEDLRKLRDIKVSFVFEKSLHPKGEKYTLHEQKEMSHHKNVRLNTSSDFVFKLRRFIQKHVL